jgi:hypothetical protein
LKKRLAVLLDIKNKSKLNFYKGGNTVMGFDFLQATPEERIITIIVLVGLLAIAGILSLYDKRKNKK